MPIMTLWGKFCDFINDDIIAHNYLKYKQGRNGFWVTSHVQRVYPLICRFQNCSRIFKNIGNLMLAITLQFHDWFIFKPSKFRKMSIASLTSWITCKICRNVKKGSTLDRQGHSSQSHQSGFHPLQGDDFCDKGFWSFPFARQEKWVQLN